MIQTKKQSKQKQTKNADKTTWLSPTRPDVNSLAKKHGVHNSTRLYEELDAAVNEYLGLCSVQDRRVPRVKVKRSVKRLIKLASDLEKYLKNVDPAMHHLLYRGWGPIRNRARWKTRIEGDVHQLARAGSVALSILDKHEDRVGGRPRHYPFQQLIDHLLDIYQELTGRSLGITWNSVDGTFGGILFRFVSDCLSVLQVKKSNAALGNALQRRIKIKSQL